MPISPSSRIAAFGDELIAVHDELRERLRQLRANVGSGGNVDDERHSLRAHCAAFCAAVTLHHTSEDRRAFPVLADDAPELRPIIAKFAEDHELIADILDRVDREVHLLPDEPTTEELRRFHGELDGLVAIMESHFSFEERRIVSALNDLPADEYSIVELFGISPSNTQANASFPPRQQG